MTSEEISVHSSNLRATPRFMFKFYFIIQLAYWLHCYPELYFQKTKKDEMSARITTATLHLIFFGVSYVLK
ncbi:hypothetical protein HPB48_024640 [Haemaphysalis longicornis]|uniref:TLC domain-containing protein n=1 Tax=Haemaphysalis longicornis TaxID=44386 RepID=A0A9J6H6M3_HAELO|nr:hypothetical protein HPB48_024640 [Haemaphysalis longicornis]